MSAPGNWKPIPVASASGSTGSSRLFIVTILALRWQERAALGRNRAVR
jgi:hypothetical protein